MEIPKDAEGLFDKLRPPRLEDAGLEDCALPLESIKEAFLKAATGVRSIISPSSDDEAEGHCVSDPWPTVGGSSDALVGILEGVDDVPGSCSSEKGDGVPEMPGDKVAINEEEEKVDEVVVGGPTLPETESDKSCIDGLQGLEIGEKGSGIKGKKLQNGDVDNDDGDNDKDKDSEKPTLVEGVV